MDTSPNGCGIALTECNEVSVVNCELARNAWSGLLITESRDIAVSGNILEANDANGILIQYLFKGSENIKINDNLIHYNTGFGVEAYAGKNIKVFKNRYAGNGTDLKSDEKISAEKYIILANIKSIQN